MTPQPGVRQTFEVLLEPQPGVRQTFEVLLKPQPGVRRTLGVLPRPSGSLSMVCALAVLVGSVASCATASTIADGEGEDGGFPSATPDAHFDGVVFNDTGATLPDTGAHDVSVAPPMDATTGEDVATTDAAAPSMDSAVSMPEASMDVATSPPDTGVDAGVSPVPTTCTEARHVAGCCADNTNYYCSSATPTTLITKACGSGKVCTWHSTYYACETGSTPAADPSGTNPIDCK